MNNRTREIINAGVGVLAILALLLLVLMACGVIRMRKDMKVPVPPPVTVTATPSQSPPEKEPTIPAKCGKEIPFSKIKKIGVGYVHQDAIKVYEPSIHARKWEKAFYVDKRFSFFRKSCDAAYVQIAWTGYRYHVWLPHNERFTRISKHEAKRDVEAGIYKRVYQERYGPDLTPDHRPG